MGVRLRLPVVDTVLLLVERGPLFQDRLDGVEHTLHVRARIVAGCQLRNVPVAP